jgi:SAM-dependent methyltransferase
MRTPLSTVEIAEKQKKRTAAPVLDWNVEADGPNIRPGSIELQQVVHRRWYEKIRSRPPEKWLRQKPYWRAMCLEKLEILLGHPMRGAVLEIGAGTALCSALASRRPAVEVVTALDYDPFCVDQMMPLVFERFDGETSKIERVHGSYNRIPRSAFYDLVIAAGALHHSEHLVVSLRALNGALKPGGLVLISDVCEFDSTPTHTISRRYEAEVPASIERYGRQVRFKDNGDHWFRLGEWLTAAWTAGFESLPFVFDHVCGLPADDSIFRRPRPYFGSSAIAYQPYFARAQYDNLMLILQKHDENGQAPIMSKASAWTAGDLAVALTKALKRAKEARRDPITVANRMVSLLRRRIRAV